ncbi:sigma 54-interacting transcriptional regulator [Alkalihalobacillus deserti]|uniref:sigma 54-interacting transcriptional regulator n=1 Tax=Alkalihalobacillus deserti TaxID=2879466 RepID=UPI001D139F0A|nr:sigma 54-interacting transcriptional regulator [Alkalihalobacillus deserti]
MQHKIAIVGYPPFAKLAREVLVDIPLWVNYEITEIPLKFLSSHDSTFDLQAFFDPTTIVVSGDRSAQSLQSILKNLVIPVKITGFDLLESIKDIDAEEIVIMNFKEDIKELSGISSLLNVRIKQIQFNEIQEAYNIMEHLRNNGIMNIVGGSWVCEAAKKLGMNGIFYYSHGAIANAIEDAVNILKVYRNGMEKTILLQTMISMNRSGIISIDLDSKVKIINNVTERLLGVTSMEVTDRNLEDIIPNITNKTPLSQWSEPQYNLIFEHKKKKLMADVVPVVVQGENMGHLICLDDVVSLQQKEQKIRKNITQKPMISTYNFNDIIGSSHVIQETIHHAKKYSLANSSILINGESGTGKELFAQSIHQTSSRHHQPFVAVNCAALPENLIDSELFGYEEGAFTGAKKGGKPGLFELAHQGTIFLDEISELPIHLQSRLLRVLQEKEIVRIGGDQIMPIDVRIIAASNKSLLDCIKEGTFREDLYFRISVLQLLIPPLRDRHGDITKLFQHFIKKHAHLSAILDSRDLELLTSHHWPGNVRELENVAERFLVLCQNEALTKKGVQEILHKALHINDLVSLEVEKPQNTLVSEKNRIEQTLIQTKGNKEKAAELLGISRTTLWRKLKNS